MSRQSTGPGDVIQAGRAEPSQIDIARRQVEIAGEQGERGLGLLSAVEQPGEVGQIGCRKGAADHVAVHGADEVGVAVRAREIGKE